MSHPPRMRLAAPLLALVNRFKQRGIVTPPTIGEMLSQLGNDTALVPSHYGHDHLVRREQLGQEHGFGWDSMRTNLYRVTE